MMRRSARVAAIGVATLSLPLAAGACDDEEPADPAGPGAPDLPGEPATVTLSAEAVHLAAIGAAYPLAATVADSNGIALGDVAVAWTSEDESVATVDGSGRVEAVGVGETEVTAEAGDASDVATIAVTQSAASVSVSPALGEFHAVGDSMRYTAVVRDANGHAIDDAAIEWSSTDEGVATVDADGWAFAEANGTAGVSAAVGEVADEAAVRVEQIVASVEVSPAADTIAQNDTSALAAEATDANGVPISGAAVTWTSSDPGLAPVDGEGDVSSAYWGVDATVTATVDGVSGTAEVHVLDQIAFRTNRDGNDEIYLMNADGSDQRRITSHGASDVHPTWSPDGMRLAFASNRDGDYEIYTMNVDGSNVLNLTNDGSTDVEPAWSPEGTDILFRSVRDGATDVYAVEADGSNLRNLTDEATPDDDPAWSPHGSKIAFSSLRDGSGDTQIFIMNADGSNAAQITDNDTDDVHPSWSPDGERIAFVSTGDLDIYVMDADGSNRVQLTDDDLNQEPAWSPDGSRIAFRSNRDGAWAIFIMKADGSNPVRITDATSNDLSPAWRPRP
ncbi:MAG: Ig-like domain-containing protein [Gemmatimonadota bacterium]